MILIFDLKKKFTWTLIFFRSTDFCSSICSQLSYSSGFGLNIISVQSNKYTKHFPWVY